MKNVRLPIQRLAAELAAETANPEQRTVDVVFYSGQSVRRIGWDGPFHLAFSIEPSAVRLGRLNAGAPLLNAHGATRRDLVTGEASVEAVVGVVERAWLEHGAGRATVRFSDRPEVEPIWRDVQNKILRNVSMGVAIHRLKETTKEGEKERSFLAVDWEPQEVSVVPVGADPGAGFLLSAEPETECSIELRATVPAKGEIMNEEVKTTGAGTPEVNVDAVRSEAVLAERRRVSEIRKAVLAAKLDDSVAQELIDASKSADEARTAVLEKLAEKDRAVEIIGHRVEVTRDEGDVRMAAMSNALLHRYNPAKYKLDHGRDYHGMSLLRLAEDCLAARGARVRGKAPMEIARQALAYQSTSDFPNILAATAYKTLRDGYEAEPATFVPFCRQVTLPNFNTFNALAIGESFDFEKVNEHGEFKYGSLAESKETYKLATYGKIVALTRQAIINDDLNAFTRIPEMHGRAARRLELDTVWGIITANAAMGDGTALFHTNHANLASGGDVGAPDVPKLGVGRKAMRLQKGVGGKARLNLRPRYLLLPAAHETVSDQLLTQITPAVVSNAIPEWVRGLVPIVEPRLDDNSTTAWYVAADPGQIDTIWYCYLQGQEGVYLETRQGFEVDGIELKARLDFGAAAIDYRGLYKNPGA